MADGDTWDAETVEPGKKAVVPDKWDGEDEEEDIKDNWDDEEDKLKSEVKKAEAKNSHKKKLSDKIKEKENLQRKKQEELRKRSEESQESTELTPDEEPTYDLKEPKPEEEEEEEEEKKEEEEEEEEAGLERANDALGVSHNMTGIDAISPSSKDDFTEFEKLLKDKLSPYEKSIHYTSFLESLFRDLCLSLEVDDLKKINGSITVLLSEKQKLEKQQNKGGKKKKKGVVPAGGFKAKMKDDLADYGEFEGGGYTQDYEDFI